MPPFGEAVPVAPGSNTGLLYEGAGPASGLSLFSSGCPRNLVTLGPVPNDGNLHTILAPMCLRVITTETGGQILAQWVLNGQTFQQQLFSGGSAAGPFPLNLDAWVVDPNSTFSVIQNTNLTAGSAKLFVSLFQL